MVGQKGAAPGWSRLINPVGKLQTAKAAEASQLFLIFRTILPSHLEILGVFVTDAFASVEVFAAPSCEGRRQLKSTRTTRQGILFAASLQFDVISVDLNSLNICVNLPRGLV